MQKRGFYRIHYPAASRPTLLLDGRSHPVLDLSEKGLKYAHTGGTRPAPGDPASGVLIFGDQEKVEVDGSVLRIDGTAVVLRLERGVPFGKIVSEQRRFLKLPPGVHGSAFE